MMKPPKETSQSQCQSLYAPWVKTLALENIFTRITRLDVAGDTCAWNRFMGGALLALVVLLFLSGGFLALYYSPVPGAAYDSVDFTLFNAPLGNVIKGIHHYSWNLLLVLALFHLAWTFIVGAYREPRQLTWVSGVAVLAVLPLFIITGDLLPWDQKGYWSTQVRLSIMASVPVIGDTAVRVLQGGPLTGIVALTRFYVFHILFLPCLLIILLAVHLHFITHHGLAERQGPKHSAHRIAFWPRIINRWLLIFIISAALIGLIAGHWPPPLGDPADPTDSSYIPKPEWWVLFLNQLVALFKGPWAVLGTTVIPGLLAGLLTMVPYLDRSSGSRHPRRTIVFLMAAAMAAFIIVLSVMGYWEHFVRPHE